MARTVMIVDDALFMRNVLRRIVVGNGYIVAAEAASGIETIKKLHSHHPDIIFLDIILPDSNGLDLLQLITASHPQSKIVVCSAISQDQVMQKAFDLGAKAFIQKPFKSEEVIAVLESLET